MLFRLHELFRCRARLFFFITLTSAWNAVGIDCQKSLAQLTHILGDNYVQYVTQPTRAGEVSARLERTLEQAELIESFRDLEGGIKAAYHEYLELAPELRERDTLIHTLSERLSLSVEDSETLVLFFELDEALTPQEGQGRRIFSRLKHKRFHELNQERRTYYEENATLLTLQEMATELEPVFRNADEQKVYNQMFQLDVTPTSIWRRPLSADKKRGFLEN